MAHLSDIMDVSDLNRLIAERYISRVLSPDGALVLYNYTAKATYEHVWTPETRACRGIVAAVNGQIIARPFEKFSNIDESGFPESSLFALLARPGPVEITEKLDGSMIVMWHYDGDWHCSTRGSFTSSQAQAARRWLDRTAHVKAWPVDYTFIGEWCAPDNRVVLKYDTPELRLIGVREYDGTDAPYAALVDWSEQLGLSVVSAITDAGLIEVAARRALLSGVEGWVARWPDGYRVKIKTDDYMRLHRLITGFSAARVRDALLSGDAGRYFQELPEELRPEAEHITAVLRGITDERIAALQAAFARLSPLLSESRKAYALAVLQEPADDRAFLFSLADGRLIMDKALKVVDLRALFGELAEAREMEDVS
jgi:RNA ligase